jgi:type II secretory pathway pseudopilin PulG
MKYKLEIVARLLLVVLLGCSVMILEKSLIFGLGCIFWCVFWLYQIKTPTKYKGGFKVFTLLELVAVLGLVAILISVTMHIKTDRVKTDSVVLKSLLTQVQTYSYSSKGTIVPFEYNPKDYASGIEESHTLYFKDGVAVDEDGYPLIGFNLKVFDKYNEDNYINIFIKSFTGKITFY